MANSRIETKLIDPDIFRAETLPTDFYNDEKLFEQSIEKIFSKSWHYALSTDEMSQHNVVPFNLLPDCMDEPLLFTRSADSRINCVSNVCTHRGNLLVADSCKANQLRCGYHGRCFNLEGSFTSTPGFEGAVNFPADRDNLPQVPMANLDKFIFVGINPSHSFDQLIAPLKERLSWLPLKDFKLQPELTRDYQIKANWLLYAENFLEGFHIPYVHPRLAATLDIKDYRYELFSHSNLQVSIASEGEHVFDFPEDSPDYKQRINAFYYYLYPNTIFDFYPWGLSINTIEPLSVNETKIRYFTYVWDESKFNPSVTDLLHQTEMEDEFIVQRVARGTKSRFYKRGRYSPQWEKNVHHFQQYIAEVMQSE